MKEFLDCLYDPTNPIGLAVWTLMLIYSGWSLKQYLDDEDNDEKKD